LGCTIHPKGLNPLIPCGPPVSRSQKIKINIKKQFMERETVIARLIGHVFGDGSIHKTKYYFIYTNSNNVLQQKVKELVIKTFGKVKYNVGTSIGGILRYQYPSRVGRFLSERGAPVGSKITQPTTIPEWIFKGDDKIKS
jgi:hypothetical protein